MGHLPASTVQLCQERGTKHGTKHQVRGALCRQSSRRDGQPQRGTEMLLINTEIYAAYEIHSE